MLNTTVDCVYLSTFKTKQVLTWSTVLHQMLLLNKVTGYCEKSLSLVITEPFNVLSSLTFILVAIFIYRLCQTKKEPKIYYLLPFFALLIGLGSLSWHLTHNLLTLTLDFVPIYLLLVLALYLLTNDLLSKKISSLLIVGFTLTQIFLFIYLPAEFNGQVRFLFAFALLFLLVSYIFKKFGQVASGLIISVLIFGLAIIASSLDLAWCEIYPSGTHFVWHVANAIAIYIGSIYLIKIDRIKRARRTQQNPA